MKTKPLIIEFPMYFRCTSYHVMILLQATVIHQQQQMVHHQQSMPPQAHQVHQAHRGMEVHVPVSGQQGGHRTYTVFNDQGMEYTDIQAVSEKH